VRRPRTTPVAEPRVSDREQAHRRSERQGSDPISRWQPPPPAQLVARPAKRREGGSFAPGRRSAAEASSSYFQQKATATHVETRHAFEHFLAVTRKRDDEVLLDVLRAG
jgi:hypothetical protein